MPKRKETPDVAVEPGDVAASAAPDKPKEPLPAELRVPTGDSPTHFVSFRLDRQRYALSLENVERVLHMVVITPVPQAPAWVVGAINLHGRVLPVVNVREQFGHPPKKVTLDDRLLVVRTGEQAVALIVDQVTEVLDARDCPAELPPEPLPRSHPLAAVIRRADDLVLVVDVNRLMPVDETP